MALLRNPDNPEAAFDHYQSNNPEQTEDYRGYTEQEFILSPKQLRSVSVFPGSCPTGISCPKGTEATAKGTRVDLKDPPSYRQSQKDYSHQNRRTFGGSGNGEDDGSGGAPNNVYCQHCQKQKPVVFNNMCFDCANDGMVAFERDLSEPPPIVRTKEVPVAMAEWVDTSAIRLSRWLVDLIYEERELSLFHRSTFYKKYELYNLLTESFLQHKETLDKFHKYWIKFSRGSISAGNLILQVGALAKNHGIDRHVEVARIVKTLARHRKIFETQAYFDQFTENKLANELIGNNLATHNELYNLVYSQVDGQKKKELMDFIYQIFKQTSDLLAEKTVPSKYDTFRYLGELSRELFRDYRFGFPNYRDGQLDIIPWGFGQHTFITQSNRHKLERNLQSQTLYGLGFYVSDNNPSTPEEVKAIFTGLAILSTSLMESGKFMHKLSQDQRELFIDFAKIARKELTNLLNSTSSEQKNAFLSSMFFVFGEVTRELADELAQEQSSTPVSEAQAALRTAAEPRHEQTTGYTLDSPLPEEIFTDYGYEIGTKWKMFARRTEAGFREPQLEAIDHDNRQLFEKVMAMLHQWKRGSRRPITFRDFLSTLKKIDRNDIRSSIEKRYNLPQL
ncbi:death domain-containing protein [Endozoicomonas sp. 8E]|uniref:death domain-containing protein n=1 Tax=Endozoicomonas sp. 8E TaxID=3035692 RepID=UPI0029391C8A|nr:death domain-containing protein [Endozoicomonas sp. 8E]WOG28537.1 death domain-containing protein [Endozoicomonas sp. 8E]